MLSVVTLIEILMITWLCRTSQWLLIDRAFPDGQAAHPEDLIENENQEKFRKSGRKQQCPTPTSKTVNLTVVTLKVI